MASKVNNHAAFLHAIGSDLVVEDRQVPTPGPGEVLVRNHAIAVNPIDWKRQAWGVVIKSFPLVLGTDISGTIISVHPSVTTFSPGDRVFGGAHAFVSGDDDHAAFQEYAVLRACTVGTLPPSLSFAQGATLPTAVSTAAIALWDVLGLPKPLVVGGEATPALLPAATTPRPALLVWGGASSVGRAAVQFAALSGYAVFAAASPKHHDALRALGAAGCVDYASTTAVDELLAAAAREAGVGISHALDAISTPDTLGKVAAVLARGGARVKKLAHTTPWPAGLVLPEAEAGAGIAVAQINGEEIWDRRADLAEWLFHEALPKWLEEGTAVPAQARVVEGGLNGLQSALDQLKEGVSGVKLVVEV